MSEGMTINDVTVSEMTLTVQLTLSGRQAQELFTTGRLEGIVARLPALKRAESPRRALGPAPKARAGQADGVERPTHCLHVPCGKKLKTSGIGRAKRFCNAKCRSAAARSTTDDEHGAAAIASSSPAAKRVPAPHLVVESKPGRLVLPKLQTSAQSRPSEPELPPRPRQVLSGQGHDPLKVVVEAVADPDEEARRQHDEDVIMRRGR